MSQPGVCGEVIVLTGCRWAPASPHKADHRRDIKWRWPHANRRGVTGRCLNVKKEREGGRKEGRKEGSMGRKTQKLLRTRFQHSRCCYTLSLCLLTSVSPFKLDLYLCLTAYGTLCCSRGYTFSCYEKTPRKTYLGLSAGYFLWWWRHEKLIHKLQDTRKIKNRSKREK